MLIGASGHGFGDRRVCLHVPDGAHPLGHAGDGSIWDLRRQVWVVVAPEDPMTW